MASESLETERKYEASADAALPPLDGLPQVTGTSPGTEFRLIADYLDTPGLRLLRAGITLRRRRGGDDDGWHLKLPAGRDTRAELHHPLGRSASVPAALSRLVRAYSRGEPLRTVARITTVRRQLSLLGDGGQPVAHIADDEVLAESLLGQEPAAGNGAAPERAAPEGAAPDRAAPGGAAAERWREVEVELTGDGGRALLDAADKRLRQAGLRRSASSAKLERALGSRLPARVPAPRLDWDSTAADVLGAYLRTQVSALQAADPRVRRDQPDAVHQMRVAARRLRATLQTFGPLLAPALGVADAVPGVAGAIPGEAHTDRGYDSTAPGEDSTARLRAELRWLGQVLGGARDAEVLAGHIAAGLDGLPPELVLGAADGVTTEHLAPRHAAARRAAIRALDSGRYLRLLAALDALLDALAKDSGLSKAGVLRAPAARSCRRVRKRMRRARDLPPGPGRDAALHEARKAAKRARYAADVLVPVAGKHARRLSRRMKAVQTVLGDHQDSVVARAALRDLAIRTSRAGDNAFTFGLLYGHDEAAALELQRQARRAWEKAGRRKYRRWLR